MAENTFSQPSTVASLDKPKLLLVNASRASEGIQQKDDKELTNRGFDRLRTHRRCSSMPAVVQSFVAGRPKSRSHRQRFSSLGDVDDLEDMPTVICIESSLSALAAVQSGELVVIKLQAWSTMEEDQEKHKLCVNRSEYWNKLSDQEYTRSLVVGGTVL